MINSYYSEEIFLGINDYKEGSWETAKDPDRAHLDSILDYGYETARPTDNDLLVTAYIHGLAPRNF